MVFDKAKWWVNVLLTVIVSFIISAAVEYSQLFFHLGLFECILQCLTDTDAFQGGHFAMQNGHPEMT